MVKDAWLDSKLHDQQLVIDRRPNPHQLEDLSIPLSQASILQKCPINWSQIRQEYRQAVKSDRSLVLAYTSEEAEADSKIWEQLVGIAKYLSRTQNQVSKEKIRDKLCLSDHTFYLALGLLQQLGFRHSLQDGLYQFEFLEQNTAVDLNKQIQSFLAIVREEKFQQQYFYKVPLTTINQELITNNN